jgi:hypothetical protein
MHAELPGDVNVAQTIGGQKQGAASLGHPLFKSCSPQQRFEVPFLFRLQEERSNDSRHVATIAHPLYLHSYFWNDALVLKNRHFSLHESRDTSREGPFLFS